MPASITDYRLYPAVQAQPSECAKVLSSVQPFDRAADALAAASRVWTVGIGTSYNAATVAAWMLRAAGLNARPITSMEFAFWPPLAAGDAVLLFAHTGRKTYTGKSLDICIERAAPTVVLTKIDTGFDLDSFPPTVTTIHTTTPGSLGDVHRLAHHRDDRRRPDRRPDQAGSTGRHLRDSVGPGVRA